MAEIACGTVGLAPDSGSENFIARVEREVDRIMIVTRAAQPSVGCL